MLTVPCVPMVEARSQPGVRLVVNDRVPSPWGEGAKALFRYKRHPFTAVAFRPTDPEQEAWTRAASAPVAFFAEEPPVTGWREILALAERVAPTPSVLPASADEAAEMMTLLAGVLDPGGLMWNRRLQLVHAGLASAGAEGFSERTARYLAPKYGFEGTDRDALDVQVPEALARLTQRLGGRRFFFGDAPRALDFYVAAVMGGFEPLPDEVFACVPSVRQAFRYSPPSLRATEWKPALLEHRARVLGMLAD